MASPHCLQAKKLAFWLWKLFLEKLQTPEVFPMEIHFSKISDLLFSVTHCSSPGSGWQTSGLRLWAESQTEPNANSTDAGLGSGDEKAWTAITQLVLHFNPHRLTELGKHIAGLLQSLAETENYFCCNDFLWLWRVCSLWECSKEHFWGWV